MGTDEEKAIDTANLIMKCCFNDDRHQCQKLKEHGIDEVHYRLGYDEDRQKSNYLNKNDNGHVTNKKIKISISG
jgi:hypothetical protein